MMALMLITITYLPIMLTLYWMLATGAALFTLLLGNLAPSFSAAVLLSASRGKTWDDKPAAKLGPLTDLHVPQSWFAHFYMVGAACNLATMVLVWEMQGETALRRAESVAGVGLCLLQVHLVRRFLESVLLFDYPQGARMHLIAYIFGLSYYIVLPLSLLPGSTWDQLAEVLAPKICGSHMSTLSWQLDGISRSFLHGAPKPALLWGVGTFLAGNLLQLHSHWILAKLRRQLSGQGKKEGDYSIPRGGAFELVSCPHYLGEIVIYAGFLILLGNDNKLCYIIFTWVVANLLLAAGPTHRWYLARFKQYPANRMALIPYLY